MIEIQQFIKATDYLKEHNQITFGEMAEAIGEKEHAITNIRRGSKKPSPLLVSKLVKIYPQVESFFATNVAGDDMVHEPMYFYNDGHALKELVETQRKLIERLEDENNKLQSANEQLKGENKALKDIFRQREKK